LGDTFAGGGFAASIAEEKEDQVQAAD